MKNVTVDLQTQRRDTLDDLLPALARLGVNRMHLRSGMAHPTIGVRRLVEIGARLRDAGIAVETYSTWHVLGENSPDSLPRKIEAAKAVGAHALLLNTPEDADIERSQAMDQRYSAEYRHLEEFVLSDWEKARGELRAAGLGVRFRWVTGGYRRSDKILRKLLAKGRGKDVGVSWHTYGDSCFVLYDLPPLLRVFGKRIRDFSMSFRNLGGWISHGYSSYPSYPQYTLDQKKDKYIEEFFRCWPQALDLLPAGVLGCIDFRIGDKEGEDEGFLVRQMEAMEKALGESERRKAAKPKKDKGGGK